MAKRKRRNLTSSSNANEEVVYTGSTLDNVTVTAPAPQWLKDKKQFQQDNPFGSYYSERFKKPVGREAIDRIDQDAFKESIFQEWESKALDYAGQELEKRNPKGKRARGKWLNSLTPTEQELINRNPRNKTTLLQDAGRGFETLLETTPGHTSINILENENLSNIEKMDLLKSYSNNPITTKLGEAASVLNPLVIPSKMVQSAYKDDYTFGDAITGVKNDAPIGEDFITDPLNLIGIGIAKYAGNIGRGLKTLKQTRRASKVPSSTRALTRSSDGFVEIATKQPAPVTYTELDEAAISVAPERSTRRPTYDDPFGTPDELPSDFLQPDEPPLNFLEPDEPPANFLEPEREPSSGRSIRELAEEYNREVAIERQAMLERGEITPEQAARLERIEASRDADYLEYQREAAEEQQRARREALSQEQETGRDPFEDAPDPWEFDDSPEAANDRANAELDIPAPDDFDWDTLRERATAEAAELQERVREATQPFVNAQEQVIQGERARLQGRVSEINEELQRLGAPNPDDVSTFDVTPNEASRRELLDELEQIRVDSENLANSNNPSRLTPTTEEEDYLTRPVRDVIERAEATPISDESAIERLRRIMREHEERVASNIEFISRTEGHLDSPMDIAQANAAGGTPAPKGPFPVPKGGVFDAARSNKGSSMYPKEYFDFGDNVYASRELGTEFPLSFAHKEDNQFGSLKLKRREVPFYQRDYRETLKRAGVDPKDMQVQFGFDFYMRRLEPRKIGQVMKASENLLPKNAIVTEAGSLSLDSFQNMLARTRDAKKWKAIVDPNLKISLNSLASDNKKLFTYSKEIHDQETLTENMAKTTVNELNALIKKARIRSGADIPDATYVPYGKDTEGAFRIKLPQITLQKLYTLIFGGVGVNELSKQQ